MLYFVDSRLKFSIYFHVELLPRQLPVLHPMLIGGKVFTNCSLRVGHKAIYCCRIEYCFSVYVVSSVFCKCEQCAQSKMSAVSQGLLIQVVTPVL